MISVCDVDSQIMCGQPIKAGFGCSVHSRKDRAYTFVLVTEIMGNIAANWMQVITSNSSSMRGVGNWCFTWN